MWEHLGIGPTEALAVAVATVGMYLAMVVLIRVVGQRMISAMSSFDLAAIIAFGAVIGRAVLGDAPRLAGGLVALVTLIALQALTGAVRALPRGAHVVSVRPKLLMAGETVDRRQLRRSHVTLAELHSRLRIAGVRHPSEVAAVVLEPNGSISVLCRGEPIDPALLDGVIGADQVPREFLTAD